VYDPTKSFLKDKKEKQSGPTKKLAQIDQAKEE
jgi:hypothetical protein